MRMIMLDGREIDLQRYGLKVLKYFIPSVEITHELVHVDGRAGPIITDTHYKSRTIRVRFMYKSYDYVDYKLFVADINALFTRKETFFIIFDEEPSKRWKVKVAQQYQPNELLRKVGELEINFICENIFAESVGTSLDLQNRKEWDVNLWAWGMGLDWDKDYNYQFSGNNCLVENLGNETVNPRQHEIEIRVQATAGSYLEIANRTTGEAYRYNAPLKASDQLVIKGVQTFLNGVSAFKNTNKRLLTLVPGVNQIAINGGTVHSIVFLFRFLYK